MELYNLFLIKDEEAIFMGGHLSVSRADAIVNSFDTALCRPRYSSEQFRLVGINTGQILNRVQGAWASTGVTIRNT
jgi:hypothetical protein